jgi:hypothetical protein
MPRDRTLMPNALANSTIVQALTAASPRFNRRNHARTTMDRASGISTGTSALVSM